VADISVIAVEVSPAGEVEVVIEVELRVDVDAEVMDIGRTAMWRTKARASLGKSGLLATRAATTLTCV